MTVVEVTITGPSDWANSFPDVALKGRLAACVHSRPISTEYWWDKELKQATEVRLSLHTTEEAVEPLEALLLSSHPFEVPCFIVSTLNYCSPDYAEWVQSVVSV